MSDKLIAVAQDVTGNLVNTVADQAGDFVKDANSKAAYNKALTLGEQIANYTCKELKEQIPPMITSTTNEIIKQLTLKIDSEQFTTDFINVLQTKLLDANSPYSEKFLSKFDDLFDRIINEAEKRLEKKQYAKEKEEQRSTEITGNGRHTKSKKPKKKTPKQTKRVRFSMKR